MTLVVSGEVNRLRAGCDDDTFASMTSLAVSAADKLALEGAPDSPRTQRIATAFSRSSGAGLLHLATQEWNGELDATLSFGRELAARFLTHLCAQPEELRNKGDVPQANLDDLLGRAPPMSGGERLTLDVLNDAWREMQQHVAITPTFLASLGAPWHVVGRVCFHLAENKANEHAPFAFLATYATGIGVSGQPQHAPLGRAVGESAADRRRLQALLEPVQRAAERSAFVQGLVERGEIFHPIAWTAEQAYAFLREVPALEQAGVVARVPDWWRARSRPQVSVTIGSKKTAGFGADALLDFDVAATLNGEQLSKKELDELLAGQAGLRLFKGRWVEVDPTKLRDALAQWQRAKRAAKEQGVSFLEAMRMLARASGTVGDHLDDADVSAGAWLKDVLAKLEQPRAAGTHDPGDALKGTLRPYQRDGVAWLHDAATLGLGACLADDMGLGKTIQVLSLFLLLKAGDAAPALRGAPHLLVVPASLLANWRAEAARFAPSLSLVVAHPSEMDLRAFEPRGVDVVLTTYGTLTRTPRLSEPEYHLVVLDEAQAIKNAGAKQTRAVKSLRCASRLALTGTPIENRLGDLWSLFDFLNPGLLGNAKSFSESVKQMEKDKARGFAPLRTLIKPYILRRMKTDKRIISDLPDKIEMPAFCALTKRQAALYADVVRELKEELESAEGMKRRGIVLASLMKMKQICNHPSHYLGDGAFHPDDSGKLARLAELCEPIIARQEKLLCFTQFKEMVTPLHAFLATLFGRPGVMLHGEVAVKKRAGLVEDFQRAEGPPFFVLSLKAGGTGLNLTAASHVVHFDRWWNPAVEDQATDRAFRIGQKRNVVVHKLVVRGTLEEKIDAMLQEKRSLSGELLNDSSEAWLTEMSDQELLGIVSLDLSSAIADG